MFYSDRQRKWFFANIAPMEKWGLGPLRSLANDPLAEAKKWGMYAAAAMILETLGAIMGWKREEDIEIIKKLEETIKGTEYRAVLTKDELGKIKKLSSKEVQKQWEVKLAKNINNDEKVKKYILDHAENFLGDELKIVGVVPKGKFGVIRAGGKKHYGIDIHTYQKEDVAYPIPYDGIVTYAGHSKDYGNYLKVLCREEEGKFFILKGGHLSKCSVQTGDSLTEGKQVGIIGNEGTTSRGTHLDIKKNYVSLTNKAIETKVYEYKVELSEKVYKELKSTSVYKKGKLTYEKGSLKLKGFLHSSEELKKIIGQSKQLAEALEKLSKKPINEYNAELKKMRTEDVWKVIQGKDKSWTIKYKGYVNPKKEAEKIMKMITEKEIPKRSNEIIKKVSKKAVKEFSTWILSSKLAK